MNDGDRNSGTQPTPLHSKAEQDQFRSLSRAFGDGVNLGARVEHEVAVRALVTALLQVLGKDPGDGPINLGAAGTWFAGDGREAERVNTDNNQGSE